VVVERFHTGSATKAEKVLLEMLEAGNPVMIHVDMGFLPYFVDLPEDFHFGGHVIVIGGYDAGNRQVYVADRDEEMHQVSLEDLALARGSKFKPFPPNNTWYTFDFDGKRAPNADEIYQAIREVCTGMLEGPISNLGVRGIRKAAERVREWPTIMDDEKLRWSCFNIHIFIDAEGGTGGGIFRYMYARFLEEAATITGDRQFADIGKELHSIGHQWQDVAGIFKRGTHTDDVKSLLDLTTTPLMEIADSEERVWTSLLELV
jgi:hypothetical protein